MSKLKVNKMRRVYTAFEIPEQVVQYYPFVKVASYDFLDKNIIGQEPHAFVYLGTGDGYVRFDISSLQTFINNMNDVLDTLKEMENN